MQPSIFSLESVMRHYSSQPDLLELILCSKKEEDRRRTEEAKLKRKEIDYYALLHPPISSPSLSTSSSSSSSHSFSPPATLQPDFTSSYSPVLGPPFITLPPLLPFQNRSDDARPMKKPIAIIHKRRKREMHAITAVVETKEFPYNDNYLWRNNGNTIHKKTGKRSIYYKCANPGCPVNKTCTFDKGAGYLIKYRGRHLSDCSTIQRIQNTQ